MSHKRKRQYDKTQPVANADALTVAQIMDNWKKRFAGRSFGKSNVELIHEGREERDRQIEQAMLDSYMYPYIFTPIYKDKPWGGRNLERLYGRALPAGKAIGESWELADLAEGVSTLRNGPAAGRSLTELTRRLGPALLGRARPMPDGRFPLLLKLLDAEDILSLQVHPDEQAVAEIGGAALKTECWYILESRHGFVYKGVEPGVTAAAFRAAIKGDAPDECKKLAALCTRFDVRDGDFHFLPAGTVHALGSGVVVAEVQTPSDTTYRVSDWGRVPKREIHVERSMQCIRFDMDTRPPGGDGDVLLTTPYFAVARRRVLPHTPRPLPAGRCSAIMLTSADAPITISHDGPIEPHVHACRGDTVLLPAGLSNPSVTCEGHAEFLEITLPE